MQQLYNLLSLPTLTHTMKGLSYSFSSNKIILLSFIILGLFGSSVSADSIICEDPKEQDQLSKCVTEQGLEGDINKAFDVCANGQGLKTCSISSITCKDEESQNKYNQCVESCGGKAECIDEQKCNDFCPSEPTDPIDPGKICGTITSMDLIGQGFWPNPAGDNYCKLGNRSQTTSSIPHGTKGCSSIYGCAQWSCLDESDKPLGVCTVPYIMPNNNGICGVADGVPTSTFPSNTQLCANGNPLISFSTPVIYNGGKLESSLLNFSIAPDNIIYDITQVDEKKYVIVGAFKEYKGESRNHIARINYDGSLDTSFNVDKGANEIIYSVEKTTDGSILIAGKFTSYNDREKRYIAKLNADGSLNDDWNIRANIKGSDEDVTIYSAIPQRDGSIIIAGKFIIVDEDDKVIRENIARLNADGSLNEWKPKRDSKETILTTLILPNGKIMVGGNFEQYILRLNTDGSLDTSFKPGETSNKAIRDMKLSYDGKITIVGEFTTYNKVGRNGIARLNTDGSLDTSFTPTGADNSIFGIDINNEGKILLGGNFTKMNGADRRYLAALNEGSSNLIYSWSCSGVDGGTNSTCSAPAIINGICGTTYNTCLAGTTGSAINLAGKKSTVLIDNKLRVISNDLLVNNLIQTRTCVGANGGATATCSTSSNPNLTGGICGTANGGVSSGFPTSNLCLLGTPIGQTTTLTTLTGGNIDYSSFNTQYGGPNSSVFGLLAGPDNSFFAVGAFTTYNGIARNRLVKVFTNGAVDTSFVTMTGANSTITSIAYGGPSYGPNQKLFVAGDFTTYNGVARNRIARLNADGSLDTSFNAGVGANSTIRGIATQEDGSMFVVGGFSTYNGVARNRIAKLNYDGTLDTARSGGVGANTTINTIKILGDGKLLIAGNFTTYNGVARNYIARLNANGSLDTSFNLGTTTNAGIQSINVESNKLIIAGNFTTYNGVARNRVATLNYDSENDAYTLDQYTVLPGAGVNGIIYSLLNYGSEWIIGGGFSTYNGVARASIARINPWNGNDLSFANTVGANSTVLAIKKQNDKFMVGGAFTTYNGVARNRITRLNADGTVDPFFLPGTGANGNIRAISSLQGPSFYVAGEFSTYNGVARNRIAKLYQDGSLDPGFTPAGSGPNNAIYGLTAAPEGKLYIVGLFTSYNGVARNRIARLNYDGTLDTTRSGGVGPNNHIYGIKLLPDGKIMVVGEFTTYNGVARNRIARLNTDGSLDNTFNPGVGASAYIYDIHLQSNGKMIVIGNFTTYNSIPYNRIARLNADGSLDNTFNPGIGPNNSLHAIESYNDNIVLVGGLFSTYNGINHSRLTSLNIGSSVETYTWSCAGLGSTASCQSYGLPGAGNLCVPYTGNAFNNNINFPSGRYSTRYASVGLGNEYFNMYSNNSAIITGALGTNTSLKIKITNLNAYKDQMVQYREPVWSTTDSYGYPIAGEYVGGSFYGCNTNGWNVKDPLTYINSLGSSSGIPITATDWLSSPGIGTYVPGRGWVNSSNPDSKFLAWYKETKGFNVECQVCVTSEGGNVNTGQACTGLPENAIPNITTTIDQYLDNGVRYPSTTYSYDTTPSTSKCNFICENNYTRNGSSCVPSTGSAVCQGTLPANAVLIQSGNTFTQTWNGNGRTPISKSYTYSTVSYSNPIDNECLYACKINYTRNGSSCIANTGTLSCNPGALNIPNAVAVSSGPIPSIRNGSTYVAQSPYSTNWTYNPTPSTAGCYYACNVNSVWSNGQCTPKTYNRSTGDWNACTLTGNTAINGLCGAANGTTLASIPSFATLCFVGTPTSVQGSGPWSWSCTGLNGGSTASCNANKISTTYMRETGNWGVCTPQGGSCQGTYTTAGACGASPTSQVVGSYGNGQMPGPYEGMLCRSFSTQATCNQGQLTHGCSRGNTTIVNNSCSGLSQSQCGIGQYGSCNWNAGASIQTRTVTCKDSNGNTVSDSLCPQPKPTISQPCNTTTYSRQISSRSACTNNTQNRTVICKDNNDNTVSDSLCPQPKPITSQSVSCPGINGICKTFTSPVYTSCNTIPSGQICNTYAGFSYQPATNTSNGCLAGQYNDISDDGYRKRQCVGSNGGTTATCNADFEELISTQCDSYSQFIGAC